MAFPAEATASEDAATDSSKIRRRTAKDDTTTGGSPTKRARKASKPSVVDPVPMDVDEAQPPIVSRKRPAQPRGVPKPRPSKKPIVVDTPENSDVEIEEPSFPPSTVPPLRGE